MKSSPLDYVYSGLLITMLLALSGLAVAGLLAPVTRSAMGGYYLIADALGFMAVFGLLSAALTRTLVRLWPMPAGEFDMDSREFTRWKLLTVVYRLGQGALKPITPFFLRPLLDSLFGARIGKDVAIGGTIDDPYQVTLGDRVIIGNASLVSGNMITGGRVRVGPVHIKAGATVGANAVIMPGCVIGEGAVIMTGAVVMAGTAVPAGETWRGNPARKWS